MTFNFFWEFYCINARKNKSRNRGRRCEMSEKEKRITELHNLVCNLRNKVLETTPTLDLQEITFVKEMLGVELIFLFSSEPLENSVSDS